MQFERGNLHLSATDLSNHVGCRHLTQQNLRVARGELKAPFFRDIRVEALRERGLAHEEAYIAHLEVSHKWQRSVVASTDEECDPVERTRSLMAAGADLIVQAALESGPWRGRADVLIKVPTQSDLGGWSYEVVDTKLARETKGSTILQLCIYAELVAQIQGVLPEHVGVVTPLSMEPERYRTLDYMAYVRRVKASLTRDVTASAETYPEPCDLCDVCRWQPVCRSVRDFTIEDMESGTTFYWEHCGMLHVPSYRRRWEEKLAWYRKHGIWKQEERSGTEVGTLIVTRDEPNGSIDSTKIQQLVTELLGT
jgi:uncharacterized protein